jgi:hypothetical protein
MTCCGGVAQHNIHIVRKNQTRDDAAKETQKGRTEKKRHWKGLECKNGIRN